jgi:hypothetical protein
MKMVHVKYVGPGNELFPQFNWEPNYGDEATVFIEDDATLPSSLVWVAAETKAKAKEEEG